MNLFISFTFFVMYMILLPEVRGQPCNETYYKLSQNRVNKLYARLFKTDPVVSTLMFAMRCSLHEMCSLLHHDVVMGTYDDVTMHTDVDKMLIYYVLLYI